MMGNEPSVPLSTAVRIAAGARADEAAQILRAVAMMRDAARASEAQAAFSAVLDVVRLRLEAVPSRAAETSAQRVERLEFALARTVALAAEHDESTDCPRRMRALVEEACR